MGMRVPKNLSLDVNGFCRFFRNKVRDPIVDSVIDRLKNTALKDKAKLHLVKYIPERLFAEIEKAEYNTGLSGVQKKQFIDMALWAYLKEIGLDILYPHFASKMNELIIGMYKEYYLEKFTRWGLADYVEKITKTDIDEDGDIGGEPVNPPVVESSPSASGTSEKLSFS